MNHHISRKQAAIVAVIGLACIAFSDGGAEYLADPISAIVLLASGIAAAGGATILGLAISASVAAMISIGASVVGGIMARRKAARAAAAARNASREALQERTLVLSSSEPSPQIIYGRCTVGGAVIDRISTQKTIYADDGLAKQKPDALQHVIIGLACHEITDVHRVHMFGEWHTWDSGTKEVGGTYTKTGASHVTVSLTFDGAGNATIPGLPSWVTVSKVLSITKEEPSGATTVLAGWTNNGAVISGGPGSTTWGVTYEATSKEPSMRVEWHPGTDAQSASPYLLSVAPGRWTAAHQLRGIAYVVLTLDLDDQRFQNGLPSDLAFDVSGKPLLDPRTGLTGWNDNTALCIYDWLRSPWGYGLTAADIDTASVVASANACDALVPHPTTANPSATGKFSRLGGAFKASDDRGSILADMAENMGGFTVPGAVWTMHSGTWSAPVLSVDDSHLVGPVQIVRSATPHDEAFNSARATIIPQGKRDTQDVDPYQNSVFVADDGGAQWQTFTLPFCPVKTQARNLLRQFVEQARAGMVISFPADMRLWPVQAGDRLSITCAEYAWTAKTFRVLDAAWAPGLNVQITAQEDIAASYDSADATDADPAPNTGLPDPGTVDVPVLLPASSGNAELIRHADGTILPRVRVQWAIPVTPYMQGQGARTDVSWRRVGDIAWTDTRVPHGDDQTYLQGMREGDVIAIAVRHVNSAGFESRWVSQSHLVIGKTAPPSDVTSLTVADTPTGGRRYTVAHAQDLDHLGYEVRYSANLSHTFAQMTAIAARWDGAALVFDGGSPVDGTWRFAVCAVDTSGNYSTTAAYATATLNGIALAAESGIGGGNQLFNSDFGLGWRGWSTVNGGAPAVRGMDLSSWTLYTSSPISGHTASLTQGAPVGVASAYHEEVGEPVPVTPLNWYCASASTGSQGGKVAAFAYFYDSLGAIVGNTYGPAQTCENNSEAFGGSAISGYKRIYGTGQAPAGAVTARIVLRKYDTAPGQTSSYMFACRAMFEQVAGASSTPGPWSPGPIGYSGDLDATKGAPAGTLVGGTLAQTVESNAANALQGVNDINADGKWSPVEKAALVVDWAELTGSSVPLITRANSFGIVAERDAFSAAVDALSVYLVGLAPPWNDTTTTTNIVRATADQKWADAYNTRSTLASRIDDEAGKRATWTTVTGAGKPQDNATVGATFGAPGVGNVSGQIVPATLTQYVAANTIHEGSSVTFSQPYPNGQNSASAIALGSGLVYVTAVGATTVSKTPSSTAGSASTRIALIVNGAIVGYSCPTTTSSSTSAEYNIGPAVISWSGQVFGPVTAHLLAQTTTTGGSAAGDVTSGTNITILALKT